MFLNGARETAVKYTVYCLQNTSQIKSVICKHTAIMYCLWDMNLNICFVFLYDAISHISFNFEFFHELIMKDACIIIFFFFFENINVCY